MNMDINMENHSFMPIPIKDFPGALQISSGKRSGGAFRTICLGGDSIIGKLTPGRMAPGRPGPMGDKLPRFWNPHAKGGTQY